MGAITVLEHRSTGLLKRKKISKMVSWIEQKTSLLGNHNTSPPFPTSDAYWSVVGQVLKDIKKNKN